MSKITWNIGEPEKDGIYWFVPDSKIYDVKDLDSFVVIVKGKNKDLMGNGGSGPLSIYHKKEYHKKSKYSEIEKPKVWKDLTSDNYSDDITRAWVKSPEGYVGFALLSSDAHGVNADIFWENWPNHLGSFGEWLHFDSNWKFSVVKKL